MKRILDKKQNEEQTKLHVPFASKTVKIVNHFNNVHFNYGVLSVPLFSWTDVNM
jgi:hypothetical protein